MKTIEIAMAVFLTVIILASVYIAWRKDKEERDEWKRR